MIVQEIVNIKGRDFMYTHSDDGHYLLQVETQIVFEEAYDILPCEYHYEEVDAPEPPEE